MKSDLTVVFCLLFACCLVGCASSGGGGSGGTEGQPAGDFVHWAIYKMPAITTALPQAVPTEETLADPPGALQGENDFGDIGYGGPAPPSGETHHYVFTLYALSEPLDLGPGADRDTLLEAMDGLILTQTQITDTYSG